MAGTALLVGVDSVVEGRLVAAVKGLTVTRAAAELSAVTEAIASGKHSTAVVSVPGEKDPEVPFRLVAELVQNGARVIVLGKSKDADLILRALRAGAQEFVVADEVQRLAEALQMKVRSEAQEPGGRIVTVFPAKGGVGASAIAANLAGALAGRGERVCLLDLDLHFGDLLSMLDLQGNYAIADVIANMSRLDRELLDSSVARHRSGVFVIGQSDKIEDAERVHPAEVAGLLGFLRKHYNHVVIDGVRGFDELSLTALDASDQILMVVTQEVPAVRNAQRSLELFRRLGYEDGRFRLILNRYHRNSQITPALLAETTGIAACTTLSNDFASLSGAINRGVLLSEIAPRSPLTRDLEQLAGQLEGGAEAAAAPARPFFARLFSRG